MKTTKDLTRRSIRRAAHGALLSLVIVGGIAAGSASASVLIVQIAPPAPRVEVIPTQRHGYTWAPGYWNWQHNQHVWVNGHSMRERKGYDWAPDRWNVVSNGHELERGHWTKHTEHGQ